MALAVLVVLVVVLAALSVLAWPRVLTNLHRFRKKWPAVRHEAGPWFLAFIVNVVLAGLVYAVIEGAGPIEGPWWGLVTGSTTGYGDLYPHSTAGRGVAAYLILSSIVLDRVFSAKLVQALIEEPNLYSHAEQERDEAAGAYTIAMLEAIVWTHNLTDRPVEERARYHAALAAVAAEETDTESVDSKPTSEATL